MTKKQYTTFILLLFMGTIIAQEDSTQLIKTNRIEVIKQFEATLADGNSIGILPTLPEVIPIIRRYEYSVTTIPYGIQYPEPVIRPIAAQKETPEKAYNNRIEIGYGNLKNPALKLDVYQRLSDLVEWNLDVDYDAADNTTNNSLQKFQNLYLRSRQDFVLMETEKLETTIGGGKETRYFYYEGLDRTDFGEEADNKREINRLELAARFFNAYEKDIELDYSAGFNTFITNVSDTDNGEANILFDARVTKRGYESFAYNFDLSVDYNTLDGRGDFIGQIEPSLWINRENVQADFGVKVLQMDGGVKIFPDFTMSYAVQKEVLQFELGTEMTYHRNNLRNSLQSNPFITSIDSIATQLIRGGFGGVKGKLNGISYGARVGYQKIDQLATFNVDFSDPQRRMLLSTADLNSVYISGSLQYQINDNIEVGATTTQQFYSGISLQELWHVPSLEFNAFSEIHLMDNKIKIRPELYLRDRVNALTLNGNEELDDLIDLNLRLEITPVDQFTIWAQGINLLDKSYRRWYGYENFGIHFQGGARVKF